MRAAPQPRRVLSYAPPCSATYSYLANSPLVAQVLFKSNTVTRMTTTKQFDLLNRLTSISSAFGSSVIGYSYSYNTANQRIRSTLADGSYWLYEYDSLGQVRSGRKYWPDQTPVAGQQFEYGFDDIGNRTQTKAGGDENGANLRSANYSANNLNQYTSRDVPGAVDIMGLSFATNTVTVSGFTAYRKGEYFRKEVAVNNANGPVWTNITVAATGQTSVSGNEFVPKTQELFSYDSDGNLTNDGRWTYTWDAENRLTALSPRTNVGPQISLKFEYDWQGRRIRKQVWSNTTWNGTPTNDVAFAYDGWNLEAELNATNHAVIRSYAWGLDLSGSLQGAGGVGGLLFIGNLPSAIGYCSPAFDGNGNVVALVSMSGGTNCATYEYGPFGEVLRATGPARGTNPFRFSSKYQDDEADLVIYPRRVLSASTGRWVSRDPAGEEGGRNLYSFTHNSMGVDPFGLVQLHYINYPQWEPMDLHEANGYPIVEYLWAGHYLTFDRADSSALGGSGTIILKYSAQARVTDCSGSPTVTPVSRQWYFATPIRLNSAGEIIADPFSYLELFSDGQYHPFFQAANHSMQAMLTKYGRVPSGQGFTKGHFRADAEVRVLSDRAYDPAQDSWTPGTELRGFGIQFGDINGHELGGAWQTFMVDQVPKAWSVGAYWSKKVTIDFDWNDCACSDGKNTWNYTPDPALTSPGAQRQRYIDRPVYYTSINLLNRPHN